MRIALKVEEVENRELAVFLFTPDISSGADANFEESPAFFSLTHRAIHFKVELGIDRSPSELGAYTKLVFDMPLECDLSVFDRTPSPEIVSGRKHPGGSIASVRYFADTNQSHLYTDEDLRIEVEREAESTRIDQLVRGLFPIIAEVISRIRQAIRLELFPEAIRWDFLIESINTVQRDKQVAEAELEAFIDDAAYLFSAFRPKGAARFPQDSNVQYLIEDEEGRSFQGMIRNSRSGRSPNLFANSLPAIQDRIHDPGSIEERVLLAACESLYADDFRMAVFNAATVLELVLVQAYENEVDMATRQAAKLERKISQFKKDNNVSHTVALLRVFSPTLLSNGREWGPLIERCVDAWTFRDKTVAHLTTDQKSKELSRTEAWEMVVSAWAIVSDIHPAFSDE